MSCVNTHDGNNTAKDEKEQSSEIVTEMLNYMRITQIRGELAEERKLDELIAKAKAEKNNSK